jgi:hypothetical protein
LRGDRVRDPGVPTINVKKCQWQGPWEVLELEILKRPPSTVKTSMMGTLAPTGGLVPIQDPRGVL